jgi:hypothetical protein
MSISGHVQNGVVVFDAGSLPEGTKVLIAPVAGEALTTHSPIADWDAAFRAAGELENYDFDAWHKQRNYDLQHARDHRP